MLQFLQDQCLPAEGLIIRTLPGYALYSSRPRWTASQTVPDRPDPSLCSRRYLPNNILFLFLPSFVTDSSHPMILTHFLSFVYGRYILYLIPKYFFQKFFLKFKRVIDIFPCNVVYLKCRSLSIATDASRQTTVDIEQEVIL